MASMWPWRKSGGDKGGADNGSNHGGGKNALQSPAAMAAPSFSTPQPHSALDKSPHPASRRTLTDMATANSPSSKPGLTSLAAADHGLQDPAATKGASQSVDMFDAADALEEFSTPLGSTPQYSTPQFSTPQYGTPLGGTPLGASPGTKYGQFFSPHAAAGNDRLGSESFADVGAQLDAASKKLAAGRPVQKGLAALLNGTDALTQAPSTASETAASRDKLDSGAPGVKASSGAAQLEGVAGGLEELEQKLVRINAQMHAKSDEGQAMLQSVQQTLKTLEEERAVAYSAARASLKDSLLRSREERMQHSQGGGLGEGLKRHAATGAPTLGTAGRSQSYASGGFTDQRGYPGRAADAPPALTGHATALGLPAPTSAAAGPPQRFQGPGQPMAGRLQGQAQQRGPGGVPAQGSSRRQTDPGGGPRGRQEMEAVGRFGRRPAAAAPMPWQQQQQEGLLAPVDEYQSIESRWERAQTGSCFMGFPSFGIGQRRSGQKAAKQQRWVVDSSWMEALRKEFMDLHARLASAEAQNQNLLQIQAEKAELEDRVLRMIEAQELHEEEVARVMSKLSELHTPALPATND